MTCFPFDIKQAVVAAKCPVQSIHGEARTWGSSRNERSLSSKGLLRAGAA